jgi:deazaflavin-dependent oxidoreductase (nitroreductase family)
MTLRHVDPNAPRGPIRRTVVRLLSTRLMTRVTQTRAWTVTWKIDPWLLRLTRGRFGTGLVLPTAVLQTVGAHTGRTRRNAVIYFHDGERVTIIASKAGLPGNPSWFYNVRANQDVVFGGQPFRAEIIEDEPTLARLWQLADKLFPAFAIYRQNAALAGRTIPVVQLVQ